MKNEKTMGQILTRDSGTGASDWVDCPAGNYQLVVVDFEDLGWIAHYFEKQYKGLKPKVRFVYQAIIDNETGEPLMTEDGQYYTIRGRKRVLSLGENAGVYKELCSIIGAGEVNHMLRNGGLDIDLVLGRNVSGIVTHSPADRGVFVNVDNVAPWVERFGAAYGPQDYIRTCLRPGYVPPEYSAFGGAPPASYVPPQQGQQGQQGPPTGSYGYNGAPAALAPARYPSPVNTPPRGAPGPAPRQVAPTPRPTAAPAPRPAPQAAPAPEYVTFNLDDYEAGGMGELYEWMRSEQPGHPQLGHIKARLELNTARPAPRRPAATSEPYGAPGGQWEDSEPDMLPLGQ